MARSDEGGSGAGLSIFALIVGLLMIAGAGAAYLLGPRLLGIANDTPAVTLNTPQELAGLKLSTEQSHIQAADQAKAAIAQGEPDAGSTIGAAYWDGKDSSKLIVVVAATVSVDSPAEKLDSFFSGQTTSDFTLQERHEVASPGAPDGKASCAAATANKIPLIVCAWADPGSVGAIFFFNRSAEEAEGLFPQFKSGVVG